MSYEVLARKLRPTGFASLVGQDHVVRALTHALDHDRLHHAYLFTGTRGVGKTTIARILAKSLNCEQGVSANPCGECSVCTEVNENRFIDLIEVDAASRTGVDDTRELLENAQYMPTRGRYKVYLIDEVHMLSIASFNALLKTLEEPPEHVKFLLATTDPKKVPVTVLSRCLQFQLKNISSQIIADYITDVLQEEGLNFEPPALEVIARSAQGSMRDALSLTDQAIAFGQGTLTLADVTEMLGVVGRNEVDALMSALDAGDASALLALSVELAERNADFADVLRGLMEALHRASVAIATQQAQGPFLSDELQLYYQIALVGLRDLPNAPDPRSGFEMTLLRMLAFTPERNSHVAPRIPRSHTDGAEPIGDVAGGSAAQVDSKTMAQTVARSFAESAEAAVQTTAEAQAEAEGSQAELKEVGKTEAQAKINEPEKVDPLTATDTALPAVAAPEQINTPVHPVDKQSEPQPEAQAESAPDAAKIESPDAATRWYDLVAQLGIGGVAKMIAEHSVPEVLNQTQAQLVLSAEHDTLLSDAQVANLSRAIEECLGQPMQVTVRIGTPDVETPAQRRARLLGERQATAEQSMRQDATVQSLLAEFDATIDEVRLH